MIVYNLNDIFILNYYQLLNSCKHNKGQGDKLIYVYETLNQSENTQPWFLSKILLILVSVNQFIDSKKRKFQLKEVQMIPRIIFWNNCFPL